MNSVISSLVVGLAVLAGAAGCAPEDAPETPRVQQAPSAPVPTAVNVSALSDDETKRRFERVMQKARTGRWHERPMGEIVLAVAEEFVGTPYKAGLLDAPDRETLIVSLNEFDCVLYLEAVLAMAQGIALEEYGFDRFADRVRLLRYRGGELDGYPSRLHYFSEWIHDNEQRGIVRNITRELGGEPLPKQLNFMSRHRKSYRHLADDANYRGIVEMEERLKDLELYYIPEDEIHTAYDRLQPGDLVLAMTDIPGLDATHTGIVYRKPGGGVGFIHASISGQVMISPDLERYVKGVKAQIGVAIARPADPRG